MSLPSRLTCLHTHESIPKLYLEHLARGLSLFDLSAIHSIYPGPQDVLLVSTPVSISPFSPTLLHPSRSEPNNLPVINTATLAPTLQRCSPNSVQQQATDKLSVEWSQYGKLFGSEKIVMSVPMNAGSFMVRTRGGMVLNLLWPMLRVEEGEEN